MIATGARPATPHQVHPTIRTALGEAVRRRQVQENVATLAKAPVALTQPGHAGRVYEVTGPRLVTFAEATALIAEATGRDITYRPVSVHEVASGLAAVGLPAEDAAELSQLLDEVLDGRNAHTADGVHHALGRPPRDFSDYVRATAGTGVWGEPRRLARHPSVQGDPGPTFHGDTPRLPRRQT